MRRPAALPAALPARRSSKVTVYRALLSDMHPAALPYACPDCECRFEASRPPLSGSRPVCPRCAGRHSVELSLRNTADALTRLSTSDGRRHHPNGSESLLLADLLWMLQEHGERGADPTGTELAPSVLPSSTEAEVEELAATLRARDRAAVALRLSRATVEQRQQRQRDDRQRRERDERKRLLDALPRRSPTASTTSTTTSTSSSASSSVGTRDDASSSASTLASANAAVATGDDGQ